MSICVSVLWDYGAKEYIWHAQFETSEQLIIWWLNSVTLPNFEKSLDNSQEFELINHKSYDDSDDVNYEYWLFLNNPHKVMLIDNLDDLSYLQCDNRVIYKNGTVKHI